MNDDNNFNIQRRNVMIINSIMFVILISNINIVDFTILNIPFKIKPDNSILTNYNIFFEVAWLYLNARYISTLIDKLNSENVLFKKNNKINQLVTNEVNTARKLLNDKSFGVKLFAIWFIILFSSLKAIFQILTPLFEKAIFDYIIPLIFSLIVFFIYYPTVISVVLIVIMFFFIGMSIDSKKLNLKHERYIERKRDKN